MITNNATCCVRYKSLCFGLGILIFGQLAAQAVAEPLTLTLDVDSSSSLLNVNILLDTNLGNRSDNDTSSFSGSVELNLETSYTTGTLVASAIQFSGGTVEVDDDLSFDLGLLGNAIDLTASDLAGTLTSFISPSHLSPNAQEGVTGQFVSSHHGLILDEGVVSYVIDPLIGSTSRDSIDLSHPGNEVTGPNMATDNGIVTVDVVSTNIVDYNTKLDFSVSLPIDFEGVLTASDLGNPPFVNDVTISVTGTINAVLNDYLLEGFVPTNGILGDLNQDGRVNGNGNGPVSVDDVSAFIAGWRTTGNRPGLEATKAGDLNFDGITDLKDFFLFHQAFRSGASTVRTMIGVPEPSGLALMLFAFWAGSSRRCWSRQG